MDFLHMDKRQTTLTWLSDYDMTLTHYDLTFRLWHDFNWLWHDFNWLWHDLTLSDWSIFLWNWLIFDYFDFTTTFSIRLFFLSDPGLILNLCMLDFKALKAKCSHWIVKFFSINYKYNIGRHKNKATIKKYLFFCHPNNEKKRFLCLSATQR